MAKEPSKIGYVWLATLVFFCGHCVAATAGAGDSPIGTGAGDPESWALYGQLTNVTQGHGAFTAPYSNKNSLNPHAQSAETTDATLYGGLRLWQGAELWLNPEIDQGFGLSDTLGVAGFPSGEAYKVGKNEPYLRLQRAFLRQAIDLNGTPESIEANVNQMTGMRARNNVTLTLGKFAVTDIFDTNMYAHDPRADFLNWTVIDAGAFDYAADAWGYTLGGAAEWTQSWWTLRGGLFSLSKIPNGTTPDRQFKQYSLIVEGEVRHTISGHTGKVKLLAFVNHGRMGKYKDALAQAAGGVPAMTNVRRVQDRPGLAINLEQEVTSTLGLFARVSANDGRKEAFEFTDVNRSLSLGLSLHGDQWGRHDDSLGLAAVTNRLSKEAKDYFTAGGMGILIGDGQMNYAPEKIIETYYALKIAKPLTVTADYQYVVNPAYNRDRGPVSLFGVRVHAEF